MIVCTKCGYDNEPDDAFCGSCGAFLEWTGEQVASKAPPAAVPQPEPVPPELGQPGLVERVKAAVGIGASEATAETAESATAEAEAAAEAEARERQAAATAARGREEAERRAAAASDDARKAEEEERARAAAAEETRVRAEAEAHEEAARRATEQVDATRRAEEAERERQAAEAQARDDAETRRRAEVAARWEAESDAKARAEEQARHAAEAAERTLQEAEARARAEGEARRAAEDAARQKIAAERKVREEAEARARVESEARAEAEKELRRRADAEAQAKAEADERAREEADANARAAAEAERAAAATKRAAALVAKPPAVASSLPAVASRLPAETETTNLPATAGGALSPTARQPEAVKPAPPIPRPQPQKTPPSRQLRPGNLICGQCGEGNDALRHFCRRCGSSLADADVVTVPWWKRLFERKPKRYNAGDRPMRKGTAQSGRRVRRGFLGMAALVTKVVALLLVAGIAIGYAGPWRSTVNGKVNDGYKAVRRIIAPTYHEVRPTSAMATTSLAGHTPDLAIDGVSNTYWAADTAQERVNNPNVGPEGEGSQLILVFDKPADVDRIGVTLGASDKPEDFLTEPRPRVIHVTFEPSKKGKDITLKDNLKFQKVKITGRDVTQVELQVVSVYGAVKGQKNPSITEVELFGKD